MDLLQLKYFEMVAEMGNVTRAAESLHIAQPSLSNTIARLEEDLGVQLFDRRGRRIVLNQFGEAFLERVKRIFHELDQGKRELMDMTGLTFGKVTIATTTSQIIPDIFSDFLATYPDVRFKLFQVTGRLEIPNQLGAGAFDFCISSLPIMQIPGMEKVVEEYLTTEEIFVAVPPGHALAEKTDVQLSELTEEKIIGYTQEEGVQIIINEVCRKAGFVPNIVFESGATDIICRLVRSGVGIAFLPEFWWKSGLTAGLVKLRVKKPLLTRTIRLSWLEGRYESLAARRFKEFIVNYFK